MNSKEEMLTHGFQMLPQLIATSKKFTHAEKVVLSKVFDMMYMHKESREWKTTCFPSNPYLMHFCHVSEPTITRTKAKVKKLGLFKIVQRYNSSDIWIFMGAPASMVKDYDKLLVQWEKMKPKTAEEVAEKWSHHFDQKNQKNDDPGSSKRSENSKKCTPKQTNRSRQRETDERSSTGFTTTRKPKDNENMSVKKKIKFPKDISIEQKQTLHLFITHFNRKFSTPYFKDDLYKIKPITSVEELENLNKLIPPFFQNKVGDDFMWNKTDHSFSIFVENIALMKTTYKLTLDYQSEQAADFARNDHQRAQEMRDRAAKLGQEFAADPFAGRWYDNGGNFTAEALEGMMNTTDAVRDAAVSHRDKLMSARGVA
jgi:hypothetical protein